MITVINKEYETLTALQNKKKVLTVMNFEDAKHLFNVAHWLEFLICLKEDNMTFGYCFNVAECEEFYKK